MEKDALYISILIYWYRQALCMELFWHSKTRDLLGNSQIESYAQLAVNHDDWYGVHYITETLVSK